jgi:hypothetical protein
MGALDLGDDDSSDEDEVDEEEDDKDEDDDDDDDDEDDKEVDGELPQTVLSGVTNITTFFAGVSLSGGFDGVLFVSCGWAQDPTLRGFLAGLIEVRPEGGALTGPSRGPAGEDSQVVVIVLDNVFPREDLLRQKEIT